MELNAETAAKFARIALGHVGREYPNSPGHVLGCDADARTPRELHPAFFGSFDWHSCVHSWWLLLTVRGGFATLPEAREIEALADSTFTVENLETELAYFQRSEARGFERPYGWGWLLYLHLEASRHGDKPWGAQLEPLAREIAQRLRAYLALLTYPITVGTHFNTAFALWLAGKWADAFDPALRGEISEWAARQFGSRSDYRGWEPGGDEFLSPVLTAALLVQSATPADEFLPWFEGLVVENGWLECECHPVTVSDRSDGKIAHLDGLNLSRAWCLWELSASCRGRPELENLVLERAQAHFSAAMPHVAGDYMGEHWLASFALLALQSRP
ncbi:hypothetical protein EH30_04565 [Erythrobacter sp. JL475]|nr:hypothetical protein EH30_04565 [Erythrobacter sp. JL475]